VKDTGLAAPPILDGGYGADALSLMGQEATVGGRGSLQSTVADRLAAAAVNISNESRFRKNVELNILRRTGLAMRGFGPL